MTTITIPKQLNKEKDLVVISRKEYDKLLSVLKIKKLAFSDGIDKIIGDVKKGKIIGPFNSVKDLKNSLGK